MLGLFAYFVIFLNCNLMLIKIFSQCSFICVGNEWEISSHLSQNDCSWESTYQEILGMDVNKGKPLHTSGGNVNSRHHSSLHGGFSKPNQNLTYNTAVAALNNYSTSQRYMQLDPYYSTIQINEVINPT